MSNVNYLSYVTREYVNHLTDLLESPYYKYFYNIFQEIKKKTGRSRLSKFQKVLVKMSKWNQELIDTEMKNFVEVNEIEYLDNLLTAIFVSMTKMMSSNSKNDHVTINLMVPKDTKFLYICLKEISRELYVLPYLYQDYDLAHYEIQRNLKETNRIIKECIERVIRRLLPMKTILDAYLGKLLKIKSKSKKRKKNEPEPTHVEHDDNMTINSYVDNSQLPEKPDIEELVKQEMKEIKNTEDIQENPEVDSEPVDNPTEELKEEPIEEDVQEKVTEELKEEPVEEDVQEEPVEEDVQEEVTEELTEEEVIEELKEEPTEEEEVIEEPIEEDVQEEKVIKVDSHPDLVEEEQEEEKEEDSVFFEDANKE